MGSQENRAQKMKPKFIKAFMKVAEVFAELSSAQRLKVGAILVKDCRIISVGYNGTLPGEDNVCEDENGNTKSSVIHAEENLLMKLTKSSENSIDSVMFVTHSPCINCAKLIANSGIKTVYYKNEYRSDEGIKLLRTRNIDVFLLDFTS